MPYKYLWYRDMIHAMEWRNQENARDIPFYMRYDFDEKVLGNSITDDDSESMGEEISSWLIRMARYYVDEVKLGAPFQFITPYEAPSPSKDWRGMAIMDSEFGPIRLDLYVHRFDWFIAASVGVRIKDNERLSRLRTARKTG